MLFTVAGTHCSRKSLRQCCASEDPREDLVHAAGVIVQVKEIVDLVLRKETADLCIGFQMVGERCPLFPRLHRVALNKAIGLFATFSSFDKGKKNAL